MEIEFTIRSHFHRIGWDRVPEVIVTLSSRRGDIQLAAMSPDEAAEWPLGLRFTTKIEPTPVAAETTDG